MQPYENNITEDKVKILSTLDKRSGIPLCIQLKNIVIEKIRQGKYIPGSRLPSEKAAAAQYEVNRHTVRSAWNILAKERILVSNPGSCWIINPELKCADSPIQGGVLLYSKGRPANWFFSDFVNTLETQCRLSTIAFKVVYSENDFPWWEFNNLIWFSPTPENRSEIDVIRMTGRNVIIANRQIFGSELPFVAIDQYHSTRDLVYRLLENGHRRIGCICSDLPFRYIRERRQGYINAMHSYGVSKPEDMICTLKEPDNYKAELKNFIQNHPKLSALFISGEGLHWCTFEALEDLKLEVPQDISLVMFDVPQVPEWRNAVFARQDGAAMGMELLKILRELYEKGIKSGGSIISPEINNGDSIKNLV